MQNEMLKNRYEEIDSSVFWLLTVSLKPETFEGMRFDFTKALSPKFFLSHRYFMLLSRLCLLLLTSPVGIDEFICAF